MWWGGTAPGPPQTPSHCWAWPKEAVPKTQSSPALPGWGCWHPPRAGKARKKEVEEEGDHEQLTKISQANSHRSSGAPLPTDTWGYAEYLRIWSCLGSIPVVPPSPEPFSGPWDAGVDGSWDAGCSTWGQRSCPRRRCETSLPLAAVMGF